MLTCDTDVALYLRQNALFNSLLLKCECIITHKRDSQVTDFVIIYTHKMCTIVCHLGSKIFFMDL